MCMSTSCNLCFPSIVNAVSDLLRSVEMIKHLISEGNKVEDLSAAWTACTLQKRGASTAPSRQVRRAPYSLLYLYSSAAIFNGKVPSFHYWGRASTKWASGVSLGRPSRPRTVAYSARRAMPSSTHPVGNVCNEAFDTFYTQELSNVPDGHLSSLIPQRTSCIALFPLYAKLPSGHVWRTPYFQPYFCRSWRSPVL